MAGEVRVYSGERSIATAVREAAAGFTLIVISPGLYRDSVRIDKPLEIVGDDSGGTIELWPADGPGFEIRADQVLIRNIRLYGRLRLPVIQARDHAVVLEDCEIKAAYLSVDIKGGQDSIIKRSLIFGGESGIILADTDARTIEACTIDWTPTRWHHAPRGSLRDISILNCQIHS